MPRSLPQRFNIIKGQIDGISRLIEKEANCRQVIEQLSAAQAAIKKITELYLQDHFKACFYSFNVKKKKEWEFLLREILKK
jgi:DNA-binding FrmR family transcriptional regulator